MPSLDQGHRGYYTGLCSQKPCGICGVAGRHDRTALAQAAMFLKLRRLKVSSIRA
jgi:hypothetical protein